jgi:uncharacterized protein YecT (DUF1311 family)
VTSRHKPSELPFALSLLLPLVGAICPSELQAQTMNAAGGNCEEAMSTAEMSVCFEDAYLSADRELNALYLRIQEELSPDELAALKEAQRLWVRYRDATCNAERALYGGGTGGAPTYFSCLAALRRRRDLMVCSAATGFALIKLEFRMSARCQCPLTRRWSGP